MKTKNFRFSQEALSLILKGLNLYNDEIIIVSYRVEQCNNNIILTITYCDENFEAHDVVIFLGYDKNYNY